MTKLLDPYTEVTIRKGVYEARFRIHSKKIYDSDLDLLKNLTHHFHGVCDYDQKVGDRPDSHAYAAAVEGGGT